MGRRGDGGMEDAACRPPVRQGLPYRQEFFISFARLSLAQRSKGGLNGKASLTAREAAKPGNFRLPIAD